MLSLPTSNRISTIYRYGAAVFGVAATTGLRFALTPYVGHRLPYVVFYLAIIPAAWLLGTGPTLLAVLLSTVTAVTFFIPPITGFGVTALTDIIGVVLFLTVNLVIIWFAELSRSAMHRLEVEVVERVRAEATILEQVHRAEFGRDIGLALTSGSTLATALDRCASLTVAHLGGLGPRSTPWTGRGVSSNRRPGSAIQREGARMTRRSGIKTLTFEGWWAESCRSVGP